MIRDCSNALLIDNYFECIFDFVILHVRILKILLIEKIHSFDFPKHIHHPFHGFFILFSWNATHE